MFEQRLSVLGRVLGVAVDRSGSTAESIERLGCTVYDAYASGVPIAHLVECFGLPSAELGAVLQGQMRRQAERRVPREGR